MRRGSRPSRFSASCWRLPTGLTAARHSALHSALGLHPAQRSPLPLEVTALGVGEDSEPSPPREASPWDASWQQAIAFQRELLAIAGWPDCRAAYGENFQEAKDWAAYCQELIDHPQRGGQGTGSDIASRKRALANALVGVAWRQELLDGLKEAEA